MADTGIHSLATFRAPTPRFATTVITPWQTALKCTADCQAPRSDSKDYLRAGQACVNSLSNLDYGLRQSAVRLFSSETLLELGEISL
jgi:hypothetical protein